MTNNNVLVFGASGYIGSSITKTLLKNGYKVTAVSRSALNYKHENLQSLTMNFAEFSFDGMASIDAAVYCAGIAHNKYKNDDLRYTNVELPTLIANRCKNIVRKFIFISSINVLGTTTSNVLTVKDKPNPKDYSAKLKYEAETRISELLLGTSSELTILRCPMVYGKGAPGNFAKLVKLAAYPLPFKYNDTLRSMLYITNLAHLVLSLISHKGSSPEVLMPADTEPLQLNKLLDLLATGQQKTSRLFHLNKQFFIILMALVGRRDVNQLFYTNCIISSELPNEKFRWISPLSHEEAVRNYFS